MVTFALLPISRPGKVEGNMAGLARLPLHAGIKLMALPLRLVTRVMFTLESPVLAHWVVVGGLLLGALKPFRLTMRTLCTD